MNFWPAYIYVFNESGFGVSDPKVVLKDYLVAWSYFLRMASVYKCSEIGKSLAMFLLR